MGLQSNYAEKTNTSFSLPAFITWIFTLGLCLVLNQLFGMEIFFLGLPGWFIAALLYMGTSKYLQKQRQVLTA
ncbi:hypothetical protein [Rhodocytophaga rosea]|uniref:hypothetical protein n=1 Tax=Rhodocytophaga rosea TaxID=2704465 RepID=UPI00293BF0C3|nr:hypothetical protein [Rhodocytophaga rosea]